MFRIDIPMTTENNFSILLITIDKELTLSQTNTSINRSIKILQIELISLQRRLTDFFFNVLSFDILDIFTLIKKIKFINIINILVALCITFFKF